MASPSVVPPYGPPEAMAWLRVHLRDPVRCGCGGRVQPFWPTSYLPSPFSSSLFFFCPALPPLSLASWPTSFPCHICSFPFVLALCSFAPWPARSLCSFHFAPWPARSLCSFPSRLAGQLPLLLSFAPGRPACPLAPSPFVPFAKGLRTLSTSISRGAGDALGARPSLLVARREVRPKDLPQEDS